MTYKDRLKVIKYIKIYLKKLKQLLVIIYWISPTKPSLDAHFLKVNNFSRLFSSLFLPENEICLANKFFPLTSPRKNEVGYFLHAVL